MQILKDRRKVAEMLRDGESRRAIIAAIQKGGAGRSVSVRTIDGYIADARAEADDEYEAAKPHNAATQLERLHYLSRKWERQGERAPVVSLERLIADITGVNAPQRVDVRAAVATAALPPPDEVDYSAIVRDATDEQLAALEALAAKMPRRQAPSVEGSIITAAALPPRRGDEP